MAESIDLNEYKNLLSRTTPGEWEYDESDGVFYAYKKDSTGFARKDVVAAPGVSYPEIGQDAQGDPIYDTDTEGEPYVDIDPQDAEFIVEAHNTIVPQCFARIEQIEAALERAIETADDGRCPAPWRNPSISGCPRNGGGFCLYGNIEHPTRACLREYVANAKEASPSGR